ncbi:MAG: PHP-associated domain-containing protein [Myxococcota bacterium]
MIIDLNVSPEGKDGARVDPSQLADAAKNAGLDGFVLSQAGQFDLPWSEYAEAATAAELKLFRGYSVQTKHGLILCIVPSEEGLAADFAPSEDGLYDATAVIDAVEALDGVTVALRPYDRDLSHPMGDHLFSLQGLGACEVNNGGVSEIANDLALEAAFNMEMPCTGGSGARGAEGLGRAATLLKSDAADEGGLCELLRDGACWPVAFADTAPVVKETRGGGRGRGRGGDRNRDRDDRGGRGRGRGRGRGGRGGRGGDDRGNVAAPRDREKLPEDIGNRVRPEQEEDRLPEDIGNRLKPGEASPFAPKQPEPIEDDLPEDDNFGNR